MISSFENQQCGLVAVAGVPPLVLSIGALAAAGASPYALGVVALVGLSILAYCVYAARRRAVFAFRNLSNLLQTMIRGDYSLRGRHESTSDAVGEALGLLNDLAERLARQALQTKESQLLVKKITDQIDVAIVAADDALNVVFANPAATRLIGRSHDQLLGRNILEFGFNDLLATAGKQLIELRLGEHRGKFYVYSDTYLEQGRRHRLIFITDIQRILQEEERHAWQSLLRVISHEINNSLVPIASITDTLIKLLKKRPADKATGKSLLDGMAVVKDRANALVAFLRSYRQLAKLAEPVKEPFSLEALLTELAALFEHRRLEIDGNEDVTVYADRAQMQQLLVNVLKNAHEAMADPDGVIGVSWQVEAEAINLQITDRGVGISNPDNVFVPFYTTKPNGSGIGLALSRQIVFNHHGRLLIENREDGPGARVTISIPHLPHGPPAPR